MTDEIIWLRLAHIVPGVFWVGTAIFLAVFLEPTLRRLGPDVQGAVMGALGRTVGIALTIAGFMTVGFGLLLTARTPGRDLADLFANAWGWAIGLGAVAAVAAVGLGQLQGLTVREIGRIMARCSVTGPTPAQAARLADLGDRMTTVGRIDALLVTAAIALMACARFVH